MTTAIDRTSVPSNSEIVDAIRERTIKIVKLTRDVFVSSYDLVLLDRSHAILGGHWKSVSDYGATDSISAALSMITELPSGWTDWGAYYFLPGLSMDDDILGSLRVMPEADQFRAFVRVKRVLVEAESVQPADLGRNFWIDIVGQPIGYKKGDLLRGGVKEDFGKLFLGERFLDRFGGNARALDDLVGPTFRLDHSIHHIDILTAALPVDLTDLHENACGEYRAAAVV
jgi:hypothetical protein